MKSYIFSVALILCAAIPGTWLAWWLLAPLGWPPLLLALLIIPLAMFFSVALYTGMVVVNHKFKIIK